MATVQMIPFLQIYDNGVDFTQRYATLNEAQNEVHRAGRFSKPPAVAASASASA